MLTVSGKIVLVALASENESSGSYRKVGSSKSEVLFAMETD